MPVPRHLRRDAAALRRLRGEPRRRRASASSPGTVRRLPAGRQAPADAVEPRCTVRGRPSRRCSPGSADAAWVYFVHSYAAGADDRDRRAPPATTAARWSPRSSRGTLWATQFHPEKSGAVGLRAAGQLRRRRRRRGADGAATRPSTCAAGGASACARATSTARRDYGDDPVALAGAFVAAGARWIHVVDLDAARTGEPVNRRAVAADRRAAVGVRGAGRRRRPRPSDAAERAARRRRRPGRARHRRRRATRRWSPSWPPASPAGWRSASTPAGAPRWPCAGWTEATGADRRRRARPASPAPGWRRVIVTDIGRDGMLAARPRPAWRAVLDATDVAGHRLGRGVGTLDDLARPGRLEAGGRAARWPASSSGKALYEGRFTVRGGAGGVRSVRVIPCLDVDAGRVVKGVQVRRPARRRRPGRAGRPLRRRGRRRAGVPRHHRLVRRPRHDGRRGGPHGRAGLHPVHRRRRGPRGRRRPPPAAGRGRQGRRSTPRRSSDPELVARDRRRVRRPVRAWWPSTPGARPTAAGWEVYTHGGRTPTGLDAVAWAERVPRRSAPARSCSPRWTATAPGTGSTSTLTRAVVDAVGVPVIASGGVGTLEHLVDGRRSTAAPTPCWPRRSSTSASTPSAEAKAYMAAPGSPSGPSDRRA